MAETKRAYNKKSDPNNPSMMKGKETAKAIVKALDDEREKQGLSMERVSYQTGRAKVVWPRAVERGGARLDTIAAVCDLLDVDIVLVDKEGRALT